MNPRQISRILVIIAVSAALVSLVGIIWHVVRMGRTELASAKFYMQQGDLDKAQVHFLLAAKWYLPGSPVTPEAVRQLIELGDGYMTKGQYQKAVAAYDDARGALYSVRWLIQPYSELLDLADKKFVNALAQWKKQLDSQANLTAKKQEYMRLCKSLPHPNTLWSLVMSISFLVWVGIAGYCAWKWDQLHSKLLWLVGGAAAFGLWILSLFLV